MDLGGGGGPTSVAASWPTGHLLSASVYSPRDEAVAAGDSIAFMSDSVTPAPATAVLRTLDDPDYRAGVVDLLSVIAYGELSGAFATVDDASRAPRLDHKLALARMARMDFDHYEELAARLREIGAEPESSMEPFTAAIDEWHRRTPPADWYEGLMKAYAGSAIANDFYAEIARYVDLETRALVERAVGADEQDAFVKQVLAEAIAQDPRLGSRLALWGRRLVGEALSQAQRVAASHDALTALLVDDGSGVGADLAELTRMFERLTTNHSERMQALGLTA